MLGSVSRHVINQFIVARAPLVNEGAIDETLGDDNVDEAECERAVGAGIGRYPQIGASRGSREPRINHDKRRIRLPHLQDSAPKRRVIGFGGVGAPKEHAARLGGEVGFDRPTERQHVHPDARVPADLPDAHVVRRADKRHEPMQGPKRGMRPSDHRSERTRTMLRDELFETTRDIVESLVPAHAFPPTTAALARATQRVVDAIDAVKHVEVHTPATAPRQDALVIGVARRIGGEIDDATVLDRRRETTEVPAEMAIRLLKLLRHQRTLPFDYPPSSSTRRPTENLQSRRAL